MPICCPGARGMAATLQRAEDGEGSATKPCRTFNFRQHLVLASASKRNEKSNVKKLVARVGYASSGTELGGGHNKAVGEEGERE